MFLVKRPVGYAPFEILGLTFWIYQKHLATLALLLTNVTISILVLSKTSIMRSNRNAPFFG